MSLVGTLAKVALGLAVAKGAGYVFAPKSGRPSGAGGGFTPPGDGDLGSILGPAPTPAPGGRVQRDAPPPAGQQSLDDMIDAALGHRGDSPSAPGAGSRPSPSQAPSGAQPSLQDMLGSILGGGGASGLPGGLGGLLEQLAGGAAGGAGRPGSAAGGTGLDALLGGLASALGGAAAGSAGGRVAPQSAGGSGGFGDLLNQSLRTSSEPKIAPAPQQEAAAGLMLKAMLQAAKCDGELDDGEKQKIMDALGDASPQDMAFVNRELSAPVDIAGLVRQVPKGLEQQIYTVSVLGIDLDNAAEAEYLASLGQALGIGPQTANAIHAKLGVPALFA